MCEWLYVTSQIKTTRILGGKMGGNACVLVKYEI